MKKIIKKIKEKNKREFVFRGGIVLLLVFLGLMPKIAHAGPIDWLLGAIEGTTVDLIAVVASFFVDLIGILVSMVVYSIVAFSNYNNFIHEEAIKHAWEIIVSFCNMFFILILLVIAFANILNIDSYKIKNTLPKVVIMAVLINFSLMICGLLIDFSQIFMMTFVNALGTSGGSFINTLGVNEYFAIVKKQKAITKGTELDVASAALGMAMTVVFMFISLIVLVCVLVIIIMRIMLLWAYSVLSPFAFLLSAFPAGKAWASKWWDRFTKELIVGPVLMFFVWLAVYIVNNAEFDLISSGQDKKNCFGPVNAFCPDAFLPLFIAIAMMVAGLIISQEIGGVSGGIAGKGMSKLQEGKAKAGKALKTGALRTGQATGRTALGASSAFTKKIGSATGSDTLTKLGETGSSWRQDLIRNKDERKRNKRLEVMRKMGVRGDSDSKTMTKMGELSETKGARYAKATALGAAGVATGGLGGAALVAAGGGHALATHGQRKAEEREKERGEKKKKEKEEAGKERDEKIQRAAEDPKYQEALDRRNQGRKDVENRREKGEISEEDYNKYLKKVEERFQNEDAVKKYEKTKNQAEEDYKRKAKDADKKAQEKNFLDKVYSESWSPLKDWHPQKVTKAAAKKGAEDHEKGKAEVSGYAEGGGKIQNNSANNWYSSNGQSGAQKVKLDTLTTDDPKSRKALGNIEEEINNLADQIAHQGVENIPKEKLDRFDNLKQGVAAYKKGGHDDTGRLNDIAEALNKIPNRDGERKSVEDYEQADYIIKT